jgi:hypothetical protein
VASTGGLKEPQIVTSAAAGHFVVRPSFHLWEHSDTIINIDSVMDRDVRKNKSMSEWTSFRGSASAEDLLAQLNCRKLKECRRDQGAIDALASGQNH